MCVQWALVNGRRVNVEAIASAEAMRIQEVAGLRPWQVSCSGEFDDEGLDVSSLKVWVDTTTHGRWALNETTGIVRDILCKEYGASMPWYRR